MLPSANLFSNSVFPMALDAWHICLKSSSKRRIQRITLPDKHINKLVRTNFTLHNYVIFCCVTALIE